MSKADINTLAGKIAAIAHNCQHKEPDQLTDQERVALAILAGASWEMTETGVRVTDAFGIVKTDGKFTVGIRKASTKYQESVK
jgi:hypothetical protein